MFNLFKSDNSSNIPAGLIVPFLGSTPPAGWIECNGANNTPDLREKFIRGINTQNTNINQVGGRKDTVIVQHTHALANNTTSSDGGHNHSDSSTSYESNHTHSTAITNSGSHSHNIVGGPGGEGLNGISSSNSGWGSLSHTAMSTASDHNHGGSATTNNVSHSHTAYSSNTSHSHTALSSSSSGNAAADGNMPLFYAMIFIMKQ